MIVQSNPRQPWCSFSWFFACHYVAGLLAASAGDYEDVAYHGRMNENILSIYAGVPR